MMAFSQRVIHVSLFLLLSYSTAFAMEGRFSPIDDKQSLGCTQKQTHYDRSSEIPEEEMEAYFDHTMRVDLHGKSEVDAKNCVISVIKSVQAMIEGKPAAIHFIPGKGNHVNRKGHRGTLFKNFSSWLEDEQIRRFIVSYHQTDGAYEVFIKHPEVKAQQGIRLKMEVVKQWAEIGDPQAQFLLGTMYIKGHKVEKNNKVAAQWLRKSAEQGFKEAQLKLGYLHAMGMGAKQSPQEALRWYHKAGEQGVAEACLNIAIMHVTGEGVPRSWEKAIEYYLKAAALGNLKAMNLLGISYRKVGKDEEAVKWDRKASEAGEPHAKVNLGAMLLIGRGAKRNEVEGVKWLREAAEEGIVEGQTRLATAYVQGTGVPQDFVEARRWYLKAGLRNAGKPSADAQIQLWHLYKHGYGVVANEYVASCWLLQAAENGNGGAQYELAWRYRFGSDGFEQNTEKALKNYQLSANQGNAKAQYAMGEMYELGIGGLKPNQKKGQALIRQAALNGDDFSRLMLGMMSQEELDELQREAHFQ